MSLRVGVVGCGSMGRNHARVYAELSDCSLTAVCDSDPVRAAEVAARCGATPFDDPEALLGRVDAVSVAVPTAAHREVAERLLRAGVDVLVEKPLQADVALIHASVADRMGNLVFEKSARNFNPIMATAADKVITEVENIVETGELDPDHIHTPGAFVDYLILIQELTDEYGVLQSHVL